MSKFEGIRITDSLKGGFSLAQSKSGVFKGQDSVQGSSLVVKIPMTHSGIKTRNSGFYLPAKMMAGAKSFTEGYEKPVIVGHGGGGIFGSSEEPEPIGRVKDAVYVDTSAEWLKGDDKLAKLYKDHMSKDKELAEKSYVELSQHVLKKYIAKGKKGYHGLGYLDGILDIPNQDAAQKILDGRYMTVSISVSSNEAWCSACGQNLVKDGYCDHRRGEMVDGLPVMVLLGDMNYEHLAVVNSPADPYAAKFELFNGNDSTELEPAKDSLDRDLLEVAAKCFVYYDASNIQSLETDQELNIVQLNDALGGVISAMSTKKKTKVEGTETDSTEPTTETSPNEVQPVVTVNDTSVEAPVVTATETQEDLVKSFMKLLKDKLEVPVEDLKFSAEFFKLAKEGDAVAKAALGIATEKEYDEKELDNYVVSFKSFFDSLIPYDQLVGEDGYKHFEAILADDAKLSAEKLKELPKGAFCGPNRSFPVVDCAHADAAKKLLDKVKGNATTKASILASVDRKVKKLNCNSGCDSTDLDTTNTACDNEVQNQQLTELSDADLKTKFDDLKKELISRDLLQEESTKDLRDQIAVLNHQLDVAYGELDELNGQLVGLEDELKVQVAERVVDLKILSGDSVEDKTQAIETHKARTLESLKDSLEDLNSKVNLSNVATKINDGISREPTGQVENPVLQNNSTENKQVLDSKKVDKRRVQEIYDTYEYIIRTKGRKIADAYIERCKAEGLIED